VSVSHGAQIAENVMIGPRVVILGDATLGRNRAGQPTQGVHICRRARIGTGAILCPPTEIGEEAVVGAAALVRNNVPARTVVVGVPARFLRNVCDDELLDDAETNV
jgi:UDP-2-acetamido-3-amino-2,3-dideoxy-glucuronate N-acetyltransferase